MFGIKFRIRMLLTFWTKYHTKAENFPLQERKLLFLLLKISLLNVFCQDYIFGENVKRKKLLPIKFSRVSLDLVRKPEISVRKVRRKKSDAFSTK